MALSTAIYDILRLNADVLLTFSDRIYPVIVPSGSLLPCITYAVSNHTQDIAKDVPNGYDEIGLKIGVYAQTYTLAETYHEYVYTALQDYKGTIQSEKILTINCTDKRQDQIVEMYWNAEVSQGQFAFIINMDFQIIRG